MERVPNQNEAAQLSSQIEDECLAAQRRLTGFAASARHTAITARLDPLGRLYKEEFR
jgi:hypothetical protein